jgi:hypothetical protein
MGRQQRGPLRCFSGISKMKIGGRRGRQEFCR